MELITTDYIKKYFPLWDRYCNSNTTLLEEQRERAQNILLGFIIVDETSITDPLREHLFNIIKKLCFDLKNGDTEFQTDPAIVSDYKATIKLLLQYKSGDIPVDAVAKSSVKHVAIHSKHRLFGHGFGPNNPGDEEHKRGLL